LRDTALRQTTLALCAVAELALNFASEELRPRLQRELRQTAQQTAETITAQLPLSNDQLTALAACAQTLHAHITEALRHPKLGKKQQGDLADALTTQNAKIQGLI
jgi:hypothetical protein